MIETIRRKEANTRQHRALMAATQGDFLMQAKARNQFGAKSIHGTANRTGGLIGEKEYEGPGVNDAYDNDASLTSS